MVCVAWPWFLLVLLGSATLGAALALALWYWVTQHATGNGGYKTYR